MTTHASDNEPDPIGEARSEIERWQHLLVAVSALLAAAANLLIFIEKQWILAAVTILLAAMGAAFYVVALRRGKPGSREAIFTRTAALGVLVVVPLVTFAVAFFVTMAPRIGENGTIFAVARFVGPPLPAPYGDCRPSDRLAHTLSDVGLQYQNVSAFELPYSIDPTGRWAGMWARWHGFLQGADTVIYGEYSFVDDGKGKHEPDRLLITPQTDVVPAFALGAKTAPLMSWRFPDRIVRIDQLCMGRSQRFLNDGRRLILAISGLRLFASQRYVAAERALREAESISLDEPADETAAPTSADTDSRCVAANPHSECSGELAFYLAVLEKRFGNYGKAAGEFAFAADKLTRPAPYINLGELYVARNDGPHALSAFKAAVATDPGSIAAWSSLSQYEREYGEAGGYAESDLELERARSLVRAQGVTPANAYGVVALGRALFERNGDGDRPEAIGLLRRVMLQQTSDSTNAIGTMVDYARWQIATGNRELAIGELRRALRLDPGDIRANFELAAALRKSGAAYEREAHDAFLAAMLGQAYTDEQFTVAGNAAAALGKTEAARADYDTAIARNAWCAYAYSSRAGLYRSMGKQYLARAISDYRKAVSLHPREIELRMALRDVLSAAQLSDARAKPRAARAGRGDVAVRR